MPSLPLLAPDPVGFPDPHHALAEPDGLVAAGGALTVEWLLTAYAHGIFPWFDSDDEHVLWWSPARRAVITPGQMRRSRSLTKRIRNAGFDVRVDSAFESVVAGCSGPRSRADGTWITPAMRKAYGQLHHAGFAHSVEVWQADQLVGGLYGVSLGRYFFGESMFSRVSDASKVAFHALHVQLQAWEFHLIDCQLQNPHLASLGVIEIPRSEFLADLARNPLERTKTGPWPLHESLAKLAASV